MSRSDWHQHIHSAADVHHGEPCIAGTRIPVALIVGSLADGMSASDVMREYPQLELADIYAALASQYDLNDLAGLLTMVTPRSVRIRRGES